MSHRLLLLVAAAALAGCSATADVYGTVGDADDLYTGTATGYANRTGTIELKNTRGNRCSGDFAIARSISSCVPFGRSTPRGTWSAMRGIGAARRD